MKKLALLALLSSSCFAQIDKVGDWHVQNQVNTFTDTLDEVAHAGYGRDLLAVRCIDNEPSVILTSEEYIGEKGQVILYRVDKGEIKKTYTAGTKGGAALIVKDEFDFISSMYGGRKLFVKFENYLGKSYTAKFQISGADNALFFYAKCGMGEKEKGL